MKFLQLLVATATFHGVAANNLRSRNAVEQVDECKDSYPCPGVKGVDSYCVDDFAPKRFKCGCMPGYTAIVNKTLIEGFYGSNDPVDVTWRPIQCIETNECLVGTHNCHENATCTNEVGSFKCECTGDLVGDGVNDCIEPETNDEGEDEQDNTLDTVSPCNSGQGCDPINSVCNESTGFCDCKGGFFKTNMASPCNQDVNECESPELSGCDQSHATCTNLIGTFFCQCKSGYVDAVEGVRRGTNCRKKDFCTEDGHKCDFEYQDCVGLDIAPFFVCVEKPSLNPSQAPVTPSPTIAPVPGPAPSPPPSTSQAPSASSIPSMSNIPSSSIFPSISPSLSDSPSVTMVPSAVPTSGPSFSPSLTMMPSSVPTFGP